jgi:hypothetical protein
MGHNSVVALHECHHLLGVLVERNDPALHRVGDRAQELADIHVFDKRVRARQVLLCFDVRRQPATVLAVTFLAWTCVAGCFGTPKAPPVSVTPVSPPPVKTRSQSMKTGVSRRGQSPHCTEAIVSTIDIGKYRSPPSERIASGVNELDKNTVFCYARGVDLLSSSVCIYKLRVSP